MNKYLNQYGLFVGQILSYLCFFYSLTILTPLQFSTAFFIYFVIFSLGIVIGYHRLLSHKSFKTRFTKLLSIIGCLSFQGSPLAWVCLHRSHHAHTDTEKDPHSPKNGWLKSFFGSSISETNPRLIRDMLRDKFQIFLYKYYFLLMAIYIGFMSLFGVEFFLDRSESGKQCMSCLRIQKLQNEKSKYKQSDSCPTDLRRGIPQQSSLSTCKSKLCSQVV